MRVYLDTCSLQRPLDSKTQVRIILEAEAVLGILMLCEAGSIELVSSEVLLFEIRHTPNPVRREYAIQALATSKTTVPLSESLGKRAGVLVGAVSSRWTHCIWPRQKPLKCSCFVRATIGCSIRPSISRT